MTDEIKSSGEDKVSWNLSQSLILQIAELLQQATYYFVRGHMGEAFSRMQSVRMLISHDLTPEESTELTDLEKKYGGLMISSGSIQQGFTKDPLQQKKYYYGRERYIDYHLKIMRALKSHGYSIPAKKDGTHMF